MVLPATSVCRQLLQARRQLCELEDTEKAPPIRCGRQDPVHGTFVHARRRRTPVVSVVGDGAALYSPQALWTAAHEKLPVTFVVVNNGEYNILKKFMRSKPHYASARANRFIALDITNPAIDFLALAASMGVCAQRVDRAGDIAPAIEASIASGIPNLIDIPISAA